MDAFLRVFLEAFERGVCDPAQLARLGEAEPALAAAALLAADADPDLGPQRARWLPELLRTARPGFGARTLHELACARRNEGLPPLDLARMRWLPRLLGSSNFLARLLLRVPRFVEEVAGDPPAAPTQFPAPDWSAIREAKYLGLLRIATRDLAGRPFVESLRELSDLADRCLAAGVVCAEELTGVDAPSLLALGKLGGRELNFSSDVDLLFLYDVPGGSEDETRNPAVARFVRVLKSGIERPEVDGFSYRVDLDLRPEGAQGPLANSVDAGLGYYESFGHEWERQMLIRLRHVAGPAGPAAAFARGITPFVYRKLIDPRVPQAVRAMKLRIEEERRRAGLDLEADLKEGPGGIRDVEFLVQALQLFHGGNHPEIRTGNVLDALALLARENLLPESACAELIEAYTWLRRTEHALQMVEERQTQRFPREPDAQLALARRMAYDEPDAARARGRLLDDWTAVRHVVRRHFDALVLGGDA